MVNARIKVRASPAHVRHVAVVFGFGERNSHENSQCTNKLIVVIKNEIGISSGPRFGLNVNNENEMQGNENGENKNSDHLKCKIAPNATQQRIKNRNQRSNRNSYQQTRTIWMKGNKQQQQQKNANLIHNSRILSTYNRHDVSYFYACFFFALARISLILLFIAQKVIEKKLLW